MFHSGLTNSTTTHTTDDSHSGGLEPNHVCLHSRLPHLHLRQGVVPVEPRPGVITARKLWQPQLDGRPWCHAAIHVHAHGLLDPSRPVLESDTIALQTLSLVMLVMHYCTVLSATMVQAGHQRPHLRQSWCATAVACVPPACAPWCQASVVAAKGLSAQPLRHSQSAPRHTLTHT